MKPKLVYIERKLQDFVSIERVFERVAAHLPEDQYECEFKKLEFGSGFTGIVKNLVHFEPPEADIYHITGHVHFIAKKLPFERTVLTIHDLRILHTSSGLRRTFLKKFFLDWPLKYAKYITTISEASKNDIVGLSGCDPDRIRVIENPVTIDSAEFGTHELDTESPVVLQVGTEPHKNLERLIKAVEGIGCRLEIVGPLNGAQKELLENADLEYASSEALNDEEMRSKYLEADLLAFCSTFEGFGLPIVEAQAVGIPVVTSDREPMRGVSGGGAVLVDPEAPLSIRKGIRSVINDKELRTKIVEKGTLNVARFEPSAVAAKYHEVYQEILSTSK
ncbi:MAG: glycosyltransferase family 4 protein [Pyrinomonadaceae bacterium]|nr:glycosyltransferase family 4 protein [Pyrinomonadaceae bacterium]